MFECQCPSVLGFIDVKDFNNILTDTNAKDLRSSFKKSWTLQMTKELNIFFKFDRFSFVNCFGRPKMFSFIFVKVNLKFSLEVAGMCMYTVGLYFL